LPLPSGTNDVIPGPHHAIINAIPIHAMKNGLTALLLSLPLVAAAQECGTGRYSTFNYFPAIDSIPAVVFGSNTSVSGTPQTLRMDIYAPADDPLQERPVVVLAFGGSFISGSRADMAPLCSELARMGYVAVAPDYRVGFFYPTTSTTMHAVQRCVHDLKGCIRYLRKTVAEDGNPYHIDPDRIIVGGVSAGAIGALHLTYMNEPSELPAPLVADSATLGGMEGTSGPLGYSSQVMACVSLSGALMDTTWIQPGDQPYCGIHETGDGVVPLHGRGLCPGLPHRHRGLRRP
jgi:poly(3-hydroxybutyrate) depolymerase